jgi:hypothetical protein
MCDGLNHLATLQQSTIPQVGGQLQTIFFQQEWDTSHFNTTVFTFWAQHFQRGCSEWWLLFVVPADPRMATYETELLPLQYDVWGSTGHAWIHEGVWNTPFRQHILSWVVISHNPSYQQSTIHVLYKQKEPYAHSTITHVHTQRQNDRRFSVPWDTELYFRVQPHYKR